MKNGIIVFLVLILLGIGGYALSRQGFHFPFSGHMSGEMGGSGMMNQGHMEGSEMMEPGHMVGHGMESMDHDVGMMGKQDVTGLKEKTEDK